MAAQRIIVRVTGRIGIEESDRLLADLAGETGLEWREERAPGGRRLSGLDLLLTAVIGGAAGEATKMAIEATVTQVRKAIDQAMARRHNDPLAIEIELPGEESGGATGDDETPGAEAGTGEAGA